MFLLLSFFGFFSSSYLGFFISSYVCSLLQKDSSIENLYFIASLVLLVFLKLIINSKVEEEKENEEKKTESVR